MSADFESSDTEVLGPLVDVAHGHDTGAFAPFAPFAIERDLVTAGMVRAWCARTQRPAPATLSDDDRAPATGLTPVEASSFAASRGMRLPTEEEWTIAAAGATPPYGFSELGLRGLCHVWEWTQTPMKSGFVVVGGVPRNHPERSGDVAHRSWEDAAAPDVGFRCAVSGEATVWNARARR